MARERWPKARRSSGANQRALRSWSGLFFLSVMSFSFRKSLPLRRSYGAAGGQEVRIGSPTHHPTSRIKKMLKLDRTDTPAGGEHATVYLVFELSKKTWQLGVLRAGSDKMRRYSIAGGDLTALASRLARCRAEAAQGGRPVRILSCYEAGLDGHWLHRWLTGQGVISHEIDPSSIEVNRRARRAKTDRIDLEKLMRTFLAYLRGEPRVCSMVHVPTVEDEDRKRRTRARERDRLCLVVKQLSALEAANKAVLRAATPGSAEAKMLQLVDLKSIGPVGGQELVNEVFYRSFDNRRQVGSYFGLTGTPYDSGASRREQGISKAGNRRARKLAIELAWLWLRHQPGSDLSCWFRHRVGDMKGRLRRVAIVALARKLMVALWRYLETGVVPTGAVLRPSL